MKPTKAIDEMEEAAEGHVKQYCDDKITREDRAWSRRTKAAFIAGWKKCSEDQDKRIEGLVEAVQLAKKYLEPDLVEPGRTVFWKLVKALKEFGGEL